MIAVSSKRVSVCLTDDAWCEMEGATILPSTQYSSAASAAPPNISWDAVHGTTTPVVRRIDHVIVRVDEGCFDACYALFADTLRLPTPWPPTEHPAMQRGGIFAGNVDFEILYVPNDRVVPTDSAAASGEAVAAQAQLYGVAFEGVGEHQVGLAQRGFAYLPIAYNQSNQPKREKSPPILRRSTFLASFWPRNGWQRFFFALRRLLPEGMWQSLFGGNARMVQWLFNRVYRQGMIFLVKHDPGERDIEAERRISLAQLEMRGGGVLGLVRVKEIAVGTTQLTESSALWRKLLRPAHEETGLCWQVGDGPALRLITAARDGIHHMVWEVASLPAAQAALGELGLLGSVMPDQITLDPAQCFGLDIRLVEAPGGFTF